MPPLQQRQRQKHIPWGRIIIAIIVSLLFAVGATIGIVTNRNSLFNSLSLIVALLGALFAFLQWIIPFSSHDVVESSSIHPPTQIPPITVHVSTPQMSQSLDTDKSLSFNGLEPPALWIVPYRRNPFFTGREALLQNLHNKLSKTKAMALTQAQAINGLGGIGKTQTVVEYAYRYRDEYHLVSWIRAATRDTIITDFVELANRLQLQEKEDQDQMIVVAAVKRWLTEHQGWLLILDNADDLDVIRDFLPTGESGHILITTRAQAVGSIAYSIPIEKMDEEEGVLLLLRRAKVLVAETSLDQATEVDRRQAAAIVATMEGLPLAIDQAGAYIEETGCGLASYLNRYNMHQKELLQRRSASQTDYNDSVATTWSLSFQRIEKANRAAADLMRLCSFIEPDEIPEEIFIKGAPDLGLTLMPVATDELKLDQALEEILQYSLMKRNEKAKILSIHRLVQAVLKARMSLKTQRLWAERAVRAVNHTLPDIGWETLSLGQRLLPHAQACAVLIESYGFAFPEAADLLIWTGSFLIAHEDYIHEELVSQRASAFQDQMSGSTPFVTSIESFSQGSHLVEHNREKEAEPLYRQALTIQEQTLGPDHPDIATTIHDLGEILQSQSQYEQAEDLYHRALSIRQRVLGKEHPATVATLNSLGLLYWEQDRFKDAEEAFTEALNIVKSTMGSENPRTASILFNLGRLYKDLDKYKEAETFLKQALAIREQRERSVDLGVANIISTLGFLYLEQGKYSEAELYLQKALTLRQQGLGTTHPNTASSMISLGQYYNYRGNYKEAEVLLRQALVIYEQVLGSDNLTTASVNVGLGRFYVDLWKYKEAEVLLQRALAIREKAVQPDNRLIANSLNSLGELYSEWGKYKEAEQFYQQAITASKQGRGSDHLLIANCLETLGYFYWLQGKYSEAEQYYQQALRIYEQILGPTHLYFANIVRLLGLLYNVSGKFEQAELCYQQALEIYTQKLEPTSIHLGGLLGEYFYYLLKRGQLIKATQVGARCLKLIGTRRASRHIVRYIRIILRRNIKNKEKHI